MPKVFISYSHESVQHCQRVLQLANALRNHGVDAELDQYHVRPPKGWPHWCEEQLRPENSEFVLLICTETFLRRVQGKVSADEGRGVFWEGSIIYDYLYQSKGNTRFVPILLPGNTTDCIPAPIRNHTHHKVEKFDLTDAGYEHLYRELTNQAAITKPSIGKFVSLSVVSPVAVRLAQPSFPIINPSRLFKHSSQMPDELVGREDELESLDAAWSGPNKKNIVTLVAWGGIGKTSLVAHWAANKLAQADHSGIELYFDWSFYSQGTRRVGDPTGASHAASADLFLKEALEFFGEPALAASDAGAWQKGERLAQLIGNRRCLLILDGMEPVQDARTGQLRDDGLRALLRGLAARNRGLCLATTRQHLPELNNWRQTTAPESALASLTDEAGAALLTKLGVSGAVVEKRELSARVKGHALTLTLLGRYLKRAHHGDIRRVDRVDFQKADDHVEGGHAFRVIAAYERWFKEGDSISSSGWQGRGKVASHLGRSCLAILRMFGLFDRPATPNCLAALREPAIPGLTDTIAALNEDEWNEAVAYLVELNLVEEKPWPPRRIVGYGEKEAQEVWGQAKRGFPYKLGEPRPFENLQSRFFKCEVLDAHPLLREFYSKHLQENSMDSWKMAHSRIFDHLSASVPYWPEGLEGLQPLYQAVAHGCLAGRFEEARADVYRNRICRATTGVHAYYSSKKLGAIDADLAAVSCFFAEPWRRPWPEFDREAQAWALSHAAVLLHVRGRLAEALARIAGLEAYESARSWYAASTSAGNLSELHLSLGDVDAATDAAKLAMDLSNKAPAFEMVGTRARYANTLHQSGQRELSRSGFYWASIYQAEWLADKPMLYSLPGYWYCDLLLDRAEEAAWLVTLGGELVKIEESRPTPRMPSTVLCYPHDVLQGHQQATGNPAATSFLPGLLELLAVVEHRTKTTLEWAETQQPSLLTIALDHLTLSRVNLYRSIIDDAKPDRLFAKSHVDSAWECLRRVGDVDFLARALLTRAWLLFLEGDVDAARNDLDDAWQIAVSCPMQLHQADIHLHRARLFFREKEYPWKSPQDDLADAEKLINACGYHRRDEELADAKRAILGL